MGFWEGFGTGLGTGLLLRFMGDIFSPTIAEVGIRLREKVWGKKNKTPVPPDVMAQLRMIEQEIMPDLRKIMGIPSFPDQDPKAIRDLLLHIELLAAKINLQPLTDIQRKLIRLSSFCVRIDVNSNFAMPSFKPMIQLAGELATIIPKHISQTIGEYVDNNRKIKKGNASTPA